MSATQQARTAAPLLGVEAEACPADTDGGIVASVEGHQDVAVGEEDGAGMTKAPGEHVLPQLALIARRSRAGLGPGRAGVHDKIAGGRSQVRPKSWLTAARMPGG